MPSVMAIKVGVVTSVEGRQNQDLQVRDVSKNINSIKTSLLNV